MIWFNAITMKTQIDLKSALCGLAVGVLVMLAIGAGTSTNEVGKYQISSAATFAVILDTQTGQAWKYVPTANNQSTDSNFFDAKQHE